MSLFRWRRVVIAALLTILVGLAVLAVPSVHALKQVPQGNGSTLLVVETIDEAVAMLNQQNEIIKQLRQQLVDKRKLECNLI